MPQGDPQQPVYTVGGRRLSIADLLRRFSEGQFQSNGICRLSDLHLKTGEPATYRFDSDLVPLPGAEPLDAATVRALLYPLLTAAQITRFEATPPTDVDAGYELVGAGLSFRINAFHDRQGPACAIRVLPREIPAVDRIGFPEERIWRDIVDLKQGLVVVTGITGSGKSTTVAALLRHIGRHRAVRVITLEDPVEYALDSDTALVSQREVGLHVRSFAGGLRAALREDPDVIFVGEMRDPETTSLALTAAETGHLVFSTLHTKDAKGAITRIVDMFPQERVRELATQLSFSLTYVLAQKLIPLAGGSGRRVAMEVLRNVPAIANLIRTARWHQVYGAMESHRRDGAITLERHLAELVRRGEVEADDARRYANAPSLIP